VLRRPAQLLAKPTLGADGLGIAAVLDVLRDTDPRLFQRISEDVRASAPEISQLVFPPGETPGTKILGVQEKDGRVFRAPEISDGVLLLIALTTVIHLGFGRPPTILGIEEPDRGIHPRRIRDIVDQLRRLAARGCQVVVTTHSPILLDEFRDEPESILLLDRDDEGTHITRLSDHPDWKKGLFSDQPLGDLWYSGLLGGVPRRAGS
jgi:predicted ATPase